MGLVNVSKSSFDWSFLTAFFDDKTILLRNIDLPDSEFDFSIPVLMLHDTGVYAVADISGLSIDEITKYLTKLHSALQKALNIAPSGILTYGITPDSITHTPRPNNKSDYLSNFLIYAYSTYTELRRIESSMFFNTLTDEFENGDNRFTETDILRFTDVFNKLQYREPICDVKDSEDVFYIRRKGILYESSDLNSELNFYLTLFGGLLGIHKFYQRKWIKGAAYLLTCGFCGAAWFIDLIELFCGIAKDKWGYYLMPVNKRTFKLIISFLWLFPAFLYIKSYLFLVTAMLSITSNFNIEIFKLLTEYVN